jgi:hypothetical protein
MPPPSSTIAGPLALRTFAVAVIVIVTGSGPQSNVMIPPAATAATTAFDVQLAGVPDPITRVGREVSTARASAGTLAPPEGLPAAVRGRGGRMIADGAAPIPCRAAGPAVAVGPPAVAAGAAVRPAGPGVDPHPASTADRTAARTHAREVTRTRRV